MPDYDKVEQLIAEAEALLEGVTPGPWRNDEHDAVNGNNYILILSGSWDIAHNKYSARSWEEEQANGRFIAASRTLVPALIEALRNEQAGHRVTRQLRKHTHDMWMSAVAERDALRAALEAMLRRWDECVPAIEPVVDAARALLEAPKSPGS